MVHIYTSILSQYMNFIRRSTARTFKAISFSIAFRKRATTPFLAFRTALSMQFAEVYILGNLPGVPLSN